jgi:hypothetical protein
MINQQAFTQIKVEITHATECFVSRLRASRSSEPSPRLALVRLLNGMDTYLCVMLVAATIKGMTARIMVRRKCIWSRLAERKTVELQINDTERKGL